MANVKDAEVILTGRIIGRAPIIARDNSGSITGYRVTVLDNSGEGGQALVRFGVDDFERYVQPHTDLVDQISWLVRSRGYQLDNSGGMSTAFLREVSPSDVEAIADLLGVSA